MFLISILFICLLKVLLANRIYLNNTYIIGRGYDPTIGKAFASYTERDQGVKLPLFAFDFSKNTISLDGQLQMPEKTDWSRELKCSGDMEHEVIDTYQKYINSRTRHIKVGVRGSFCIGFWIFKKCFSYDVGFSRDSYKYKRHIQQFKSVYYHFFYKCTFYWGGLLPNEFPSLHQGFAKALANLPESFDKSNPNPFYEFFDDFGTHYIHHATLGAQLGQIYELSHASSDILQKTYRRDAQWAKFGPFYSQHSSSQMSELEKFFSKYSRSQSMYVGGGKIPQSGNPLEWMNKVGENPVPVDFEIKPISELLILVKERKLSQKFENYEERLNALEQAIATYFESKSLKSTQQAQKQDFEEDIQNREATLDSSLGSCAFCHTCGGKYPAYGGWINHKGGDFFGLGTKCSLTPHIVKSDGLHLCCSQPLLEARGFCRFIILQDKEDQTPQNDSLTVVGKVRVSEPWAFTMTGLGWYRKYHGVNDVGLACTNKMCALCNTCGGQYQYFAGAFWENWQTTHLGNQCKGQLQPRIANYGAKLCCRNGLPGQKQVDLQNGGGP